MDFIKILRKSKAVKTGLLLVFVIVSLFLKPFFNVSASSDVIAQGSCGASASWVLYTGGELVISGTGNTYDYTTDSPFLSYYASINKVTVGEGITGIGNRLFKNCNKIASVTLPTTLTKIGSTSFYCCKKIITIEFPSTLKSIGANAFYGCSLLTQITYDGNSNSWNKITVSSGNDILKLATFTYNVTILAQGTCGDNVNWVLYNTGELSITGTGATYNYPSASPFITYAGQITEVTVGEGVTSIGERMFKLCSNITSVTIPTTLTNIGASSFYCCTKITTISLPGSILTIGKKAFDGCKKLVSVNYTGSELTWAKVTVDTGNDYLVNATYTYSISVVTSGVCGDSITWKIYSNGDLYFWGSGAMANYASTGPFETYRKNILSVYVSDGITTIGDRCFKNCNYITSIVLPDSLTGIGVSSFYGCSKLTAITLPANLLSIGMRAFDACAGLVSVTYKGNTTQWSKVTIGEKNDKIVSLVNIIGVEDPVIDNTNSDIIVENSTDFVSAYCDGAEQVFDNATFLSGCKYDSTSGTSTILYYDLNKTFDTSDVLILRFTVYAKDKSGSINVSIDGSSYNANYYITTQKTEFYVPLTGYSSLNKLKIQLNTEYQQIYVGNVELVNYNSLKAVSDLKSGPYLLDSFETDVLDESSILSGTYNSCITDGTYLYALASGTLNIENITDRLNPVLVGSVSGLGSDTRDMDFCANGKAIMVTSRENGVYIINIENPALPVISSRVDTLELASGLCIYGNYAFICSRYFGTEIWDISDINNPTICSTVSSSEEQIDCTVSNGYLYVGVWGQKCVEVYNVNNVENPVFVSKIALDGNGYGCYVDNNVLYVATGYHSSNASSKRSDPGYGMGNGMELYNVTDPANPVWLSTVKIDGQYYYSGNDIWKVYVSDGQAYLTSTYNGIFVYDVTNTNAPKRLAHISEKIETTSALYTSVTNTNYVFPFDTKTFMQSPILSIALLDGNMYMASPVTGIKCLQKDWIKANKPVQVTSELTKVGNYFNNNPVTVEGMSVNLYQPGSSVYAVKASGGFYFTACGADGIQVLDENLNCVSTFETNFTVKDIAIKGNILFAAISDGGINAYQIDGSQLTYLSNYNKTNSTDFSQLQISASGNYLLAQAGWTCLEVVNITDVYNMTRIQRISMKGTLYYRNLCNGVAGSRFIGFGSRNYLQFSTMDESGTYSISNELSNSIYSEANGMAADGNYVVSIYKDGYTYFDPSSITQDGLTNLPVIKVGNLKLSGKCSIYGNYMVVSTEYNGTITIINIADLANPVLVKQFTVNGNPDIAAISDNTILIPCKWMGLIKLTF